MAINDDYFCFHLRKKSHVGENRADTAKRECGSPSTEAITNNLCLFSNEDLRRYRYGPMS